MTMKNFFLWFAWVWEDLFFYYHAQNLTSNIKELYALKKWLKGIILTCNGLKDTNFWTLWWHRVFYFHFFFVSDCSFVLFTMLIFWIQWLLTTILWKLYLRGSFRHVTDKPKNSVLFARLQFQTFFCSLLTDTEFVYMEGHPQPMTNFLMHCKLSKFAKTFRTGEWKDK